MRLTMHSKERLVERDSDTFNFDQAKRQAKIAWRSGKTINHYQDYPRFFMSLQNRKAQSRSCSIRVYNNNIYVWRGEKQNRKLITVVPIADRYKKEMENRA